MKPKKTLKKKLNFKKITIARLDQQEVKGGAVTDIGITCYVTCITFAETCTCTDTCDGVATCPGGGRTCGPLCNTLPTCNFC